MKIRKIIIALLLVVTLIISTGCDLLPGIETQPQEEPSEEETSVETNPINPMWEVPTSTNQNQPLPSIADVVAKVKPSVVAINTEVVTYDFFNRAFTQEGAGSGWIISEDGIIVTNNHVVEGAESITVVLDDGRTYPVDMSSVATDGMTDLAVLKIEAENLTAAKVGDSEVLRVGDWVVAIGNSLGQGTRATLGIVSQNEVEVQEELGQPLRLIETDAAINPGNSGGPLVDMTGKVIGINSIKLASVEIEGVGYAISSNEATPIIQQLINTGYVVRPWMGVGLYTVDDYVVFRYNLTVEKGIFITEVADDSPASKAGIEAGDVIVKFGDTDTSNVSELTMAIHEAEVGQAVKVTYWRGNSEKTATVILAQSPPPK